MTAPIGPHPTALDAVRKHVDGALADLHVAIPARVTRVDLARGLVDAHPLVKDADDDATGARVPVSMPVVTNVPLVFPGAGGMRITFPVAVGDTVLLVFADRALDLWLVQGGEVDPLDDRRHQLSDAIAIPGLRDFGHPWKGIDPATVTIGKDGAIQHFAALADRVADALSALKTAVNDHIHTAPSGGGPTSTATAGTVGTLPNVASATVKITE